MPYLQAPHATNRLLSALLVAAVLAGCGGGSKASVQQPEPHRSSTTAAENTQWKEEVDATCADYGHRLDAIPANDGTAAGTIAYIDAKLKLIKGTKSATSFNLPTDQMATLDKVNALTEDALASLETASKAAAANDLAGAEAALTASDDFVNRIAQTWLLAGAPCGADPARAEAADLNVALEMSPGQLGAGFDSIWAVESTAGRVVRLDPDDGKVQATIDVGAGPFKLQPADGSMWQRTAANYVRIDPTTNTVTATLAKSDVGPDANRSWAVDGAVWICDGRRLHRYDPTTLARVATIDLDIDCGQVFATTDTVVAWTYNEDDGESGTSSAAFVDPSTNRVVKTLPLPADVGVPIVLDAAVFFPGSGGNRAVVVDRATLSVTATPDLGHPMGGSQSGFDGTSMYICADDGDHILKVDAGDYSVTGTIAPIHANTAIVADDALWVADGGGHDIVQRFDIAG